MRPVANAVGAIGDDILQSFEPHGFVGLAFFESGARSVYTVRRPVLVEMFAALGAEPVGLPYTRTSI
jgi:TRAP-type C4-dicarboxylate transport system substrate-binding protein